MSCDGRLRRCAKKLLNLAEADDEQDGQADRRDPPKDAASLSSGEVVARGGGGAKVRASGLIVERSGFRVQGSAGHGLGSES